MTNKKAALNKDGFKFKKQLLLKNYLISSMRFVMFTLPLLSW